MWPLIAKDLIFNKKMALFGLAFAIFIILAARSSPQGGVVSLFLAPFMLCLAVLGKGLQMDERNNAYSLLKSLPIRKSTIVVAKYAEALLLLAFAYAMVFLVNFVSAQAGLDRMSFDGPLALLLMSMMFIFLSLYLWLFFRFGFAATQMAAPIMFVLMVAGVKLHIYAQEAMDISLAPRLTFGLAGLIAVGAMALFLLSGKLSMREFGGS